MPTSGELNTSAGSDNGDYSILLYETQDAFHHSQGLRQKLKFSNEKLREKTKNFEEVVKENEMLKSELLRVSKEKMEIKELYNERFKDVEHNLINISGRNEWLEGKTEELKELCKIWKNKSLANDTKADHATDGSSKPIPKLKYIADELIIAKKRELLEKIQTVNKKKEIQKNQINREIFVDEVVGEEPWETTLIGDTEQAINSEEESSNKSSQLIENGDDEADEKDETSDVVTKHFVTENDNTSVDDIKNQTITMSNHMAKPVQSEIDDEKKQKHVVGVPMETILKMSKKNDTSVTKLISYCQNLIQQNTFMLQKICEQSRKTTMKLESWIESYMILKRNTEQEEELHERDLNKSLKTEKEYKIQIQNLCEMITRLTKEVTSARNDNKVYEESFKSVKSNLERLDQQFELVASVTKNKMANVEERLRILLTKVNHVENSPTFKKKTTTKRFAKNLFRLKRRLSESNESLQQN